MQLPSGLNPDLALVIDRQLANPARRESVGWRKNCPLICFQPHEHRVRNMPPDGPLTVLDQNGSDCQARRRPAPHRSLPDDLHAPLPHRTAGSAVVLQVQVEAMREGGHILETPVLISDDVAVLRADPERAVATGQQAGYPRIGEHALSETSLEHLESHAALESLLPTLWVCRPRGNHRESDGSP